MVDFSNATPRPWRIDRDDREGMGWNIHITDESGNNRVCFMSNDGTGENIRGESTAALIVHAVNCHDELVAALKAAEKALMFAKQTLLNAQRNFPPAYADRWTIHMDGDVSKTITSIDSAIIGISSVSRGKDETPSKGAF